METTTNLSKSNLEYGNLLSKKEWDLFVTFTYRNKITETQNRNNMNEIFNFSGINEMFWIIEFAKGNYNLHTHSLISTHKPKITEKYIKNYWTNIGRIDIVQYDKEYNLTLRKSQYEEGTGLPYYITKCINYYNTDWDIQSKIKIDW